MHAARGRFLEEGVDGASLRAIARDAGTSLGMVYYYFPAKDDLFFAVVEDVYAKLVARLEVVLTSAQDTEGKVKEIYQIFATLEDEELTVMRLIIKEAMASSQRLTRLFERFSRGHVGLMLKMIVEGMQKGELRRDMPPMVLVMCTIAIGLLPQLLTRRLREVGVPVQTMFPAPDGLALALTQIALHGIGKPDGAE